MVDSSTNPSAKKLAKAPSIGDLAPAGIDGRLWTKVLKEQLMNSKDGEVTDAELFYFATVCHNTGLDPATRQIYAIFRNVKQKDGTYKPRMTVQTGIDGFRVVAERTGKYAGSDEPEFTYDPDLKISVNMGGTPKLAPNKAKVSVIKLMDKVPYRTIRTANWMDYYPGEGPDGMMWRKLPETMLSKVAEAQALRAAFPNEMSGLYLEEEMKQADTVEEGTDMAAIKVRVVNAKTYDDLMDILGDYSPEIQKQITPWVDSKAKELI